jgi:hypothetical protein
VVTRWLDYAPGGTHAGWNRRRLERDMGWFLPADLEVTQGAEFLRLVAWRTATVWNAPKTFEVIQYREMPDEKCSAPNKQNKAGSRISATRMDSDMLGATAMLRAVAAAAKIAKNRSGRLRLRTHKKAEESSPLRRV